MISAPTAPAPTPAHKQSRLHHILELCAGHVELLFLEGHFEITLARRRMHIWMASYIAGAAAFVLLHIAIIQGFLKLGLPMGIACLILGVIDGVTTFALHRFADRRPDGVSEAFQSTRQEWMKSLRDIEERLAQPSARS